MTQVLISGASGFVGRALLPALCRVGYTSLVLVDRNPLPSCTRKLVLDAGGSAHEIVAEHLPEPTEFPDVEYVVCLAGATSVDAALHDPRPAVEGNVRIAVDLAEWTRLRSRPTYVVYVSSDEVLGESFDPVPDSASLEPTQPYAASKAAAELILHCYRDVYDLAIATIRSCNLIGPGQREPKLIPVAVRALLAGEPIPIHGSGSQVREWMAVEDFASAIVTLITQKASRGIYQAATGIHRSVIEVAGIVSAALDRSPTLTHVADRLIQDRCYAMDASRLRNLGWAPQRNPDDAIIDAARAIAFEMSPSAVPYCSRREP